MTTKRAARRSAAESVLAVLREEQPAVGLAAVGAMAWLPVADAVWNEAEPAMHHMLDRLLAPTADVEDRRRAIEACARVPLSSVHDRIVRMATDKAEPERFTALLALAEQQDPEVVPALVKLVQQAPGIEDERAVAALAALPIEGMGVKPRALQKVLTSTSPDVRMWAALAAARLGDFGPLDREVARWQEGDLPHLFDGSPWTAYERLAAIRPVPEAMATWLRAREERIGVLAWAVTGDRDAEGSPVQVGTSGGLNAGWGASVPEDVVFEEHDIPTPYTYTITISPEEVATLRTGDPKTILAVVDEAFEDFATSVGHMDFFEHVHIGNQFMQKMLVVPANRVPLGRLYSHTQNFASLLDPNQLAFLGARAGADASLQAVGPIIQSGQEEAKIKAFNFLENVGKEMVAPSYPFRGETLSGGGRYIVDPAPSDEMPAAEAAPPTGADEPAAANAGGGGGGGGGGEGPPPPLYWNSRFPEEPDLRAGGGKVVVGRVYAFETAIEAKREVAGESTPVDPRVVAGQEVEFELRGTGVSFRPRGTDEPFSDFAESGPLLCTASGTPPYQVDCRIDRAGELFLEARLVVSTTTRSKQKIRLTGEPIESTEPATVAPSPQPAAAPRSRPSVIDAGALFRAPSAQLQLELDRDGEYFRLRLSRFGAGKMGRVASADKADAVEGAAAKVRSGLIGQSKSYRRKQGGKEFEIEEAGEVALAFAQAGFDLHRAIFGVPGVGDETRTKTAHAIALAGRRDDSQHDQLQIDAEATGIPWSILYDAKAYAHARKELGELTEKRHESRPADPEDVDLSCFWGYRFDIFHDYSVEGFPPEVLGTTTPLAQAVLNGSFPDVSARQRTLFTAGSGSLADLVQCNPVVENAQGFLDWARAGPDQPCDLLYLFCHAWAPSEFLDSGLRSSAYNPRESYLGLEQTAATARTGRVTLQEMEDAWSGNRDRQPLVFLHACGSGENDATYGRPFVEYFLGNWAGRALVGTQWTVATDFADLFSREVLAAFARPGTAIIHALRQASDVAFAQGNVFPLIYALFGRNDLCLGKG